ncbi:unnamed protein product, partial [Mesorhabditis spiculigera]
MYSNRKYHKEAELWSRIPELLGDGRALEFEMPDEEIVLLAKFVSTFIVCLIGLYAYAIKEVFYDGYFKPFVSNESK